jgi:hypothetical protein
VILASSSNHGSVTSAKNAIDDLFGPRDWRDPQTGDQYTRCVAVMEFDHDA